MIIEATNITAAPKPTAFPAMPLADEEFLAEQFPEQQLGLALVSEGNTGIPLFYQSYSGGLPLNAFYNHMEHLLARVSSLGVATKDVTLLLNQEMAAESLIAQVDAKEGMHFIASCAPDFAPELTEISLKDFRPLPGKVEAKYPPVAPEDDKTLYYETKAPFWNRQRRVILTFDPKCFHRSYQELGKKVQRVRKEMAAFQQRFAQETALESAAESVKTHLEALCQRLKISPALFQINFVPDKGQFRMEFQLDHRQMAGVVRHFGKNILITDHEDWSVEEIYEACVTRAVLGPDLVNGNGNGKVGNSVDGQRQR